MNEKIKKLLAAWKEILETKESLYLFSIGDIEKRVLELYIFQNKTINEITKETLLTKFRVGQLMDKGVLKMTAQLQNLLNLKKYTDSLHKENQKLQREIEQLKKSDKEINKLHNQNTLSHELLAMPIEKLELNTRAFNCLIAQKIQTVKDVLQFRKRHIQRFRNMGEKSFQSLQNGLLKIGVYLTD